jgi:hypothetical protein
VLNEWFLAPSLTRVVVEVEVPRLPVGGRLDVVLGAHDLEVLAERLRRVVRRRGRASTARRDDDDEERAHQ